MQIAEQLEFRPRVPVVVGNVEYQQYEAQLRRMDEILTQSGLAKEIVKQGMETWIQRLRTEAKEEGRRFREPNARQLERMQRVCRQAFRCNLGRQMIGKEYRFFSLQLAQSSLLQWFCQIDRLEQIRVPSKSTLERYDKMMPESQVREWVHELNRTAFAEKNRLELETSLRMDGILTDTTCVKANIHFPTDWILLRDAVRSLLRAIHVIRNHGLKHRMPDPDQFMSQMNRLCIEMSQRSRTNRAANRKIVLRRMKALTKLVGSHAERYAQRLQADWAQQTDLREGEMKRILARIQTILDQLPRAIQQAHERIIGGRQVKNHDKILSLYEPDVRVMVRHKSGCEVEFGNTLLLSEQTNGVIVDWKLYREQSPGDCALLPETLRRIHEAHGCYPSAAGGDRGFNSKRNSHWLMRESIFDATCPRDPQELSHRMANDPRFRALQKRRAQTEGRIGIVKNAFLGSTLRSKSFAHRELTVTWAVFAHNLWLLARLPKKADLAQAA